MLTPPAGVFSECSKPVYFDPQVLIDEPAEVLRERLYTRRDQLLEGQLPVPLKLVHVNRCPVLAPLGVLREEDCQRLQLDMTVYQQRIGQLQQALWQDKLPALYGEEAFAGVDDPEQQLYDGFIGDRDRRLCERVRTLDPQLLSRETWMFDDERLPELLFRYRARNFPDTLSEEESRTWNEFCRQRLLDPALGAPNTLAGFAEALAQWQTQATPAQGQVLAQWQDYVTALKQRLAL